MSDKTTDQFQLTHTTTTTGNGSVHHEHHHNNHRQHHEPQKNHEDSTSQLTPNNTGESITYLSTNVNNLRLHFSNINYVHKKSK